MNPVKSLIRRKLRERGWELTKVKAENGERFDVISALIERVMLLHPQGAVLQIGANDAALTDPIFKLIRRYNRSAILVEPLPDIFERLTRNVASVPSVRLLIPMHRACRIGSPARRHSSVKFS